MADTSQIAAFWFQRLAASLALAAIAILGASAEPTLHGANLPDAKAGAELPNEACPKRYVGSDPIIENFGAREAPYEGFLVFPKQLISGDYNEISHHYTRREYTIAFRKVVNNVAYGVGVIESDRAQFSEPDKENLAKYFSFNGRSGRVFVYQEHLTERPALALYWFNPPKQRLSISAQLDPAHPLSSDDLINFLKAMTPATGIPALVGRPAPPCP